ncbi:MAG TPA: permease, partial [Burkholderiales bacterium]|nr:permease [Burkholderiales bacterium]
MATRGLLFDQAPPPSVPLRFLLTAPWFAVLAAALLAWAGPDAVASRWTPALLGVTHLLTLGFMAMTMLGALFQILPVVGGAPLPGARTVASIVHPALALGALALAIGMTLGMQWAIRAALALLAAAFIVFLVPAARCLLRGNLRDPALRTIGLALLGLLLAISLGATMATAFGWAFALPLVRLTALHTAWGLLGWTVLLVAGVAQQVVPMFQATAPYPQW